MGTWALGGFFNGGVSEKEAIETIHAALDQGVKIVDTAPLYGFGRTEQLVGKALKGRHAFTATKFGLGWKGKELFRDARKETVRREIEGSLRRLQADAVDLYQLHWPDPLTPIEDTAEALRELLKEGKIGSFGMSNCTLDELKEVQKYIPVSFVQPAYNLFEREIEKDLLPYCKQQGIQVLGFSALCRGLLGAKLKKEEVFRPDDLRAFDPKFQEPHYSQYLLCVEKLKHWAEKRASRPLAEVAIRWILDRGVVPIWGPENRSQLFDPKAFEGWSLKPQEAREIDRLIESTVLDPVGLEFLAPPLRELLTRAVNR